MLGSQNDQREEKTVNLRAIGWNKEVISWSLDPIITKYLCKSPHIGVRKQHSVNIFFMFLYGQSFGSKEHWYLSLRRIEW